MSCTITAFEAKTRLGRLLDRVQAGEELLITRHGRPVAKLVPVSQDESSDSVDRALAAFKQIREALKARRVRISRKEIRDWISEGLRRTLRLNRLMPQMKVSGISPG